MNDEQNLSIDEKIVLSKFEGDPVPENEIERLHIHNGTIVRHEIIENQQVVATTEYAEKEGD